MRRELGLREAVALGVGGTVGGGIFVLVGVAVGQAGPAALVAFLLAFGASVAIALPYAELACRLPLAGGGYAFVRRVLGPHWGFLMGWGYWGAYVFLSGYVTLGFGGYLQAASGLPAPVGAVALVVACTALNLLGVKVSGRAQAAVVLVAVVGLCGLVAWGLPGVELEQLRPFAPHGAGGVVLAAQVAFLSFGGFDMVAAAGEEVRHPQRNLPRAILLTLAAVLGLYLLVAFVALGTVPAGRLAASKAPLAAAAEAFGGTAARRLVVASALLTTAATANAVLVVTSRVAFAMGRDRLLPARLGTIPAPTPHGWPWRSTACCLRPSPPPPRCPSRPPPAACCTCCTSCRRWSRSCCCAGVAGSGRRSPPRRPACCSHSPSRPSWRWPSSAARPGWRPAAAGSCSAWPPTAAANSPSTAGFNPRVHFRVTPPCPATL